jgi:indolepyruvate ferredoxin oxidoreductase alpha subunit
MEKALGKQSLSKIVAVIGDSTFIHSGITGLIDIVYNKGFSTVIILDNGTTAMTGHQPTAASGITIMGERSTALDLRALCKAIGVKRVYKVNPHDVVETGRVLKRELGRSEPSVIIAESTCVMLPEARKGERILYSVSQELCTGCGSCLKLGCPAIEWIPGELITGMNLPNRKKRKKGFAKISIDTCAGCGQCTTVCKSNAIIVEENHGKGR